MKIYVKADTYDITEESRDERLRVAKDPNTRPSILNRLADSSEQIIRLAVADNPNTQNDTLSRLIFDRDHNVQQAAAGNPNTSVPVLVKFLEGPQDDRVSYAYRNILTEITERPDITDRLFHALINAATPAYLDDVLGKIAQNTKASPEILREVSSIATRDNMEYVLNSLVSNPNIPDDLLEEFSQSDDQWRLGNLAGNPNLSGDTLRRIFDGRKEIHVRSKVLRNPNCPQDLLVECAFTDPSAVVVNPNTPTDIIYQIYENQREKNDWNSNLTLCCILANPNVPQDILYELVSHPSELVRCDLAKRTTAPDILIALSKDRKHDVREIVAKNPHTPTSVLDRLSKDRSNKVRTAVASNPNISFDAWQRLSQDEHAHWAAERNSTYGED